MRANFFKGFIIVLFSLNVGCISIPKQAPVLSEEIGKRVASVEQSHINLLHVFFNEKRSELDDFITETWIPEFANNVFKNPTVESKWNEIVSSNDIQQRMSFIIQLGTGMQEKINAKRLELVLPLNEIEQKLEQEIRENYTSIKSANNAITSYLNSAVKVDENRKKYLSMFGISDDKINNTIDKVDSFVSGLAGKAETVQQKEEKVEEYLQKLKELKSKI